MGLLAPVSSHFTRRQDRIRLFPQAHVAHTKIDHTLDHRENVSEKMKTHVPLVGSLWGDGSHVPLWRF